jgi:hypothetical protein
LAIGSEVLVLAEHVAHPLSLEFVLVFNAMLHVDRGEPVLALQRVESAKALVAEQRLGFVMEPRFLRGAALSAHGAYDESVSCLAGFRSSTILYQFVNFIARGAEQVTDGPATLPQDLIQASSRCRNECARFAKAILRWDIRCARRS